MLNLNIFSKQACPFFPCMRAGYPQLRRKTDESNLLGAMHRVRSICDDYYVTRGLFNLYLRNDIHGFVARRAFIKFILH